MIPSTSSLHQKTLKTRGGKSSGWAAFDLEQRCKLGLVAEPQLDADPFPSIPRSTASIAKSSNNSIINNSKNLSYGASFSSVLLPPVTSSSSTENTNWHNVVEFGCSSGTTCSKNENEQDCHMSIRKLKELHKWADDSLIKDVLSAVGNDVEEASSLLKGMAPDVEQASSFSKGISPGSAFQKNKVEKLEHNPAPKDVLCLREVEAETDASLGNNYDLCVQGSSLQDCIYVDKNASASCGKHYPYNRDVKLILGQLRTIPLEPEWEESDIYLTHRKDALKMLRSAAQHSKAASNAFSIGDHSSARQYSLKAQAEWFAAETLNAKAAKEILSIRNCNNDLWKLDLHGLHATEAIQALEEHLRIIETEIEEIKSNGSDRIPCIKQCESSSALIADKLAKHQAATRQKSSMLQVITGVGNHSRGEAMLPTAVKNYLSENGYRFDEARPGMITVRPKLRLR